MLVVLFLFVLLGIPTVAWAQADGAFITWDNLKTFGGQVVAVGGLTAIIFRGMRALYAGTPEAAVQFVAVILSMVTALLTTFVRGGDLIQWVVLGVFNGVLTGQVVIKSLDWAVAAKTNTGLPSAGVPERPPQWYVDLHPELFPPPAKTEDK